MKKQNIVAGLAAMTGIVLLAGGAVPPIEGDESARKTFTDIEWRECDPERTDIDEDKTECGFIELPINWADRAGETFKSRIYRQKVDGPSRAHSSISSAVQALPRISVSLKLRRSHRVTIALA